MPWQEQDKLIFIKKYYIIYIQSKEKTKIKNNFERKVFDYD